MSTPRLDLTASAACFVAAGVLLGLTSPAQGQVGDISDVDYPGWIPSDRVEPTVEADVRFDTSAGEWVYEYSVANGASAEQDIKEVWFRFQAPDDMAAQRVESPQGWSHLSAPARAAIPGLIFAADLPEGEDFERWPPAPAQIPPGQSLAGFRVTSPYPPGEARTYVRGHAPVPFLPAGFEGEPTVPHDTTNAQRGWSVGPTDYREVSSTGGGQRSDVDALVVFMNLERKIVRHAPTPIAIRLNDGARPETLQIELNKLDVTSQFQPGGPSGADLVGYFEIDSSPLQAGRNVLRTQMDGEVVGNNGRVQVHTDRDRIQFEVVP